MSCWYGACTVTIIYLLKYIVNNKSNCIESAANGYFCRRADASFFKTPVLINNNTISDLPIYLIL